MLRQQGRERRAEFGEAGVDGERLVQRAGAVDEADGRHTRREVGDETASVIVIESTVHNPELINNIGGGQEVEVSWALIDETQEACQSQPGTVEEGGSATWKTVHFNTDEVHELRVNYEEGQDMIEIEQSVSIQYDSLETPPNA